ncbi:SAP domain-containing ribonucleoprotein [Phlebotomus argentipes]|uniref:SAP domain-containing ribonucleoprotein n=1 Tax=Phlebotomus argentipes TaxID=94469 RepID=UPI0028930B84|nr:SAP domain-containing ribonucleoprotein [Phlebotomus argentipes]
MADTDFSKMKVADLKRELKNRGLSTGGNKTELQERLQMALLDSDPVLEDTAISEELDDDEVLNDEELENAKDLLEETSHEDVILASPSPSADSTSLANKFPDETKKSNEPPTRKIVLKRKLIVAPLPDVADVSPENSLAASKDTDVLNIEKSTDHPLSVLGESDKKVIKLSDMSAQERLELRMKKFGAPVTSDVKKMARAERFGTSSSASSSNGSGASIDVLKKRAERFGGSVSTTMTKMENEEKLKKRQERFGASTVAGKISVNSTAKSEYETKAQQRLERFKTTVK